MLFRIIDSKVLMKKTAITGILIIWVLAGCASDPQLSLPTTASGNLQSEKILTGAEKTASYLPLLKGKRIAVCANHTSRIGSVHLVDTLLSSGVPLVKIFSPEHGFRGDAEAGAHIRSSVDAKTGLPIVSLYGNNKKPTAEQVADIDIILFDIQDVGCRFYTYISTLHYVMECAAENNKEVIILDRPNPNGYFIDGPVLDMKYKSFVGMHPVPVVHGMTMGEYGKMINGEGWLARQLKCKLTVIAMDYYTHSLRYSLPYPPSPNLQTDEAVYLYPSLCLFEGTAISVGRGTSFPFQIYGHPSLTDGDYFFTPEAIKGVSENPPLKGKKCRGYHLGAFARENLHKENRFSLTFLIDAFLHFPGNEVFFTSPDFFDKLAGNNQLRQQIINKVPESEIRASWQTGLAHFKSIRNRYLLYPDFE